MDSQQLRNILESCLLVAGKPMSIAQLEVLFDEDIDRPARTEIKEALVLLQQGYEGRGIELVEIASGWRLQSASSMEHWVGRLFQEKQPRYSRALLETLVLIAYRQPITRGEIEEVRGVAVSSNIIRTLQEREWVKEMGYKDVPGKPALWGTTKEFLDYFNLKRLDELPTLAEARDLAEIDAALAAEVGLVDGMTDSVAANDSQGEGVRDETGVDSTDSSTEAGTDTEAGRGADANPEADTGTQSKEGTEETIDVETEVGMRSASDGATENSTEVSSEAATEVAAEAGTEVATDEAIDDVTKADVAEARADEASKEETEAGVQEVMDKGLEDATASVAAEGTEYGAGDLTRLEPGAGTHESTEDATEPGAVEIGIGVEAVVNTLVGPIETEAGSGAGDEGDLVADTQTNTVADSDGEHFPHSQEGNPSTLQLADIDFSIDEENDDDSDLLSLAATLGKESPVSDEPDLGAVVEHFDGENDPVQHDFAEPTELKPLDDTSSNAEQSEKRHVESVEISAHDLDISEWKAPDTTDQQPDKGGAEPDRGEAEADLRRVIDDFAEEHRQQLDAEGYTNSVSAVATASYVGQESAPDGMDDSRETVDDPVTTEVDEDGKQRTRLYGIRGTVDSELNPDVQNDADSHTSDSRFGEAKSGEP